MACLPSVSAFSLTFPTPKQALHSDSTYSCTATIATALHISFPKFHRILLLAFDRRMIV